MRLLGDDGEFAPVPRWTRNEVRLDDRDVLQDQLYAKTLGVRKAAHCLTGAVLSLLLAVALEAPPHRCALPPLGRAFFSVPIEFSQRQNEDQLDRLGGPLDA